MFKLNLGILIYIYFFFNNVINAMIFFLNQETTPLIILFYNAISFLQIAFTGEVFDCNIEISLKVWIV